MKRSDNTDSNLSSQQFRSEGESHRIRTFAQLIVGAALTAVLVVPNASAVGGLIGAAGSTGPESTSSATTPVEMAQPQHLKESLASESGEPICYGQVIDAPVSEPFRPPTEPWNPGNRGLKFASTPGQQVHAAADGTVTFAGPVAHDLHVTIDHGNGLHTSYAFMADFVVEKGQIITRGAVLGQAGSVFHLGLRHGNEYLDPEVLGESPCGTRHAYLVPLSGRSFGGRSSAASASAGSTGPTDN